LNFCNWLEKAMSALKTMMVLLGLCLTAAAVSGCGKKGSLEPPAAETSVSGETKEARKDASKDHKPHILDGLLR
jgi:predicted small lipoprotein YifL